MIHGAVLGDHGEALAARLHQANDLDWSQEVWSHAAMGLLLQELYISTNLMTNIMWDTLAEALRWSRENSKILEDTHWALPASCEKKGYKPHGWAAWRGHEGFLTLRNPQPKAAKTLKFSFADVLELPSISRFMHNGEEQTVQIKVLKRFATSRSSRKEQCGFMVGSSFDKGVCSVGVTQKVYVNLESTELLILQISQSIAPNSTQELSNKTEL